VPIEAPPLPTAHRSARLAELDAPGRRLAARACGASLTEHTPPPAPRREKGKTPRRRGLGAGAYRTRPAGELPREVVISYPTRVFCGDASRAGIGWPGTLCFDAAARSAAVSVRLCAVCAHAVCVYAVCAYAVCVYAVYVCCSACNAHRRGGRGGRSCTVEPRNGARLCEASP